MPTRKAVRDQIRRVADIETDGNHITDAEINEDLNSSIAALWAILVDASNGALFSKLSPQLQQIGDNAFRLPADFLRLVSVDILRSGTYINSNEADQQRYVQLLQYAKRNITGSQHYLQWNQKQQWYELFVFPAPAITDLVVRYIPSAPEFTLDDDNIMFPADWVRWSVYDVGIKCNIKEETDPSPLMIERDKIEKRIINDIKSQSVAQVKTIRDVTSWEDRGTFRLPPIRYGETT